MAILALHGTHNPSASAPIIDLSTWITSLFLHFPKRSPFPILLSAVLKVQEAEWMDQGGRNGDGEGGTGAAGRNQSGCATAGEAEGAILSSVALSSWLLSASEYLEYS